MKTIDILVVEDDPFASKDFKKALESQGHEVTSAATVSEAENLITAKDYSMYVLDMRIPYQRGEDDLPDGGTRIAQAIVSKYGRKDNKYHNSTMDVEDSQYLKNLGYICNANGDVVQLGKDKEKLLAILEQIL